MKYRKFGESSSKTILLLHGGGLSWWNYREAAELLQKEFRVILPVLDGHAGSDRAFTAIEDNAGEILAFIDEHLGGSVSLLGGLSLGAQTALEIVSRRKDVCSCALIESAAVLPSKLTNALIGPAFGMSYGLVKHRSFAKMQFRSLRMKEDLFEEYYRDTCAIRKDDMIAFMKASTSYTLKDQAAETSAKLYVFAGEKETKEIRESAREIVRKIPSSELVTLNGLRHGEFPINHAAMYAEAVRQILRGKLKPIRIPSRKAPAPKYDAGKVKPVIRSSICTGEKTAGFKDLRTGAFREVMLIRNDKDLDAFLKEYGIDQIDTEY